MSFILLGIVNCLADQFGTQPFRDSLWLRLIFASILSAVLGFFATLINKAKWFEELCSCVFGISPKKDLLTSELDSGNRINVVITLKDKTSIMGHYAGRDTSSNENWFCVSSPIYYNAAGEIIDQTSEEANVRYLCRMEDIDHIEIV